MSSAAESQSFQRATSPRPEPGAATLPGYRSHIRKDCTTLSAPATASARPCHTSDLLKLLEFQRSKGVHSFPPGLPVQGTLRRRCSDLLPRDH
eukprot:365270-Chlamydomonas_euryale.AAC.21